MPTRLGYSPPHQPWDTLQRDELSREFTVPHHSTWVNEVAVDADIVTTDADVNLIPVGNEITLHSPKYGLGTFSSTIVSSSVANPTVITTTIPHGLTTGDTVTISGHIGSTPALDGDHVVTVLTPTTFTIPVNVTVGGAGGTVTLLPTPNVICLLQVTGYTVVVPRTLNFIVALAAVDLTGANPVPGGANTPLVWWTYSGFTNAAGGSVTITAGSEPVIRYSICLKA